jgi:hypothetical protein
VSVLNEGRDEGISGLLFFWFFLSLRVDLARAFRSHGLINFTPL